MHGSAGQMELIAAGSALVGPKGVMFLLQSFKSLLASRQIALQGQLEKLTACVSKINELESGIGAIETLLADAEPELVATKAEYNRLVSASGHQHELLSAIKDLPQLQEAEEALRARVSELEGRMDSDFAACQPGFAEAEAALHELSKTDFSALKSAAAAPPVLLVAEALCHLLGLASKSKGKKEDWFGVAKPIMADGNLAQRLLRFDRAALDDEVMAKLQPVFENQKFVDDVMDKQPTVVLAAYKWIKPLRQWYAAHVKSVQLGEELKPLVAEHAAAEQALSHRTEEHESISAKHEELQRQSDQMAAAVEQLSHKCARARVQLDGSRRLLSTLASERSNWDRAVAATLAKLRTVLGDAVVGGAFMTYLGEHRKAKRAEALDRWLAMLRARGFAVGDEFNLASLTDEHVMRKWHYSGLPRNPYASGNSFILHNCVRWPLLLDEQSWTCNWLRSLEAADERKLAEVSHRDGEEEMAAALSSALRDGSTLVYHTDLSEGHMTIRSVIERQFLLENGERKVSVGDAIVPVADGFRLVFICNQPNADVPSDMIRFVTPIDATVSMEGLNGFFGSAVCAAVKPAVEKSRVDAEQNILRSLQQVVALEQKVIDELAAAPGSIADDEQQTVNIILTHTALAREASQLREYEKIHGAAIKSWKFAAKPAAMCAIAFGAIQAMNIIERIYCFQLAQFLKVCRDRIDETRKTANGEEEERDMEECARDLVFAMYTEACSALKDEHQLLLQLAIAMSLVRDTQHLSDVEWRFVLDPEALVSIAGASVSPLNRPAWVERGMWVRMQALSLVGGFDGLDQDVHDTPVPTTADPTFNGNGFSRFVQGDELDFDELPPRWRCAAEDPLRRAIDRLLLVRCLRPDKFVAAAREFVVRSIGPQFAEPRLVDVDHLHRRSSAHTPLLLICFEGQSLLQQMTELATKHKVKVDTVSLGQPHEEGIAEQVFTEAIDNGHWVFLINCHLSCDWLETLDSMVGDIPAERVNPSMRLWLTSEMSEQLPFSLLQRSLRLVVSPPSGLRLNLQYLFKDILDHGLNEPPIENDPFDWNRLLFSLACFHVSVQERYRFGPTVWVGSGSFPRQALLTALHQLRWFIRNQAAAGRDFETRPLQLSTIRYVMGECCYSGHLQTDHDTRLMLILASHFGAVALGGDEYSSSIVASLSAVWPECLRRGASFSEYGDYIATLPLDLTAQMCGLHAVYHAMAGQYACIQLTEDLAELAQPAASLPDYEMVRAIHESEFRVNRKTILSSGVAMRLLMGTGRLHHRVSKRVAQEEQILELGASADGDAAETDGGSAKVVRRRQASYDELVVGASLKVKGEVSIMAKIVWMEPSDDDVLKDLRLFVVLQEVRKYNSLVEMLGSSIDEVLASYTGQIALTAEVELLATELMSRTVPTRWMAASYSCSVDSLDAWLKQLRCRLKFCRKWAASIEGSGLTRFALMLLYQPRAMVAMMEHCAYVRDATAAALVVEAQVVDDDTGDAGAEDADAQQLCLTELVLEAAGWDRERRQMSDPVNNPAATDGCSQEMPPVRNRIQAITT